MTPEDRKFSDDEVQKILQKALELQEAETKENGSLNLRDLEQVAQATGIRKELIQRAARELEHAPKQQKGKKFFGAPVKVSEYRAADHPVSAEQIQDLLSEIPSLVGTSGNGNASTRTLSWYSSTLETYRRGFSPGIRVITKEDRTEIEVTENLGNLAGGLFGGLMGGLGIGGGVGVGVGVGIGALASPLFAVLVPLGFLGGSYLLARTIFTSVSNYRQKKCKQIADTITDSLADPR